MHKYILYMNEFLIRRGDNTFEPSKYQEDILRFAKHGVGNGFINACAGASKTTMLENILFYLPENKSKLFIAFNKSIVDEMKHRIGDNVSNINITTYHSLGYSILNENYRNRDFVINEEKYSNYIRRNILSLTAYGEIKSLGRGSYTYITNIIHLVEYARYYLASGIVQIKTIADKFSLNILRDECIVCKKVLDWGRENIDEIDFTDMIWLVNEFNLTTRLHKYDILLIDEAQDTSIMQQKMTDICKKRGCRTFVVGDEKQSINTWAGSDMNAVEKFKGDNVTEFELPISYRCPKKIVEFAKKYSPNIEYAPNAIDGEIRYNVSLASPIAGDMVLCRNTAPLIELHQKYLKINKKSYIKGGEDISNVLINMINDTNSVYTDIECSTYDGLIPKLYQMLLSNIDKLISGGYEIDDAYRHSYILEFYDRICCIKTLSANIILVKDLIKKIEDIFYDRSDSGIMLSTIHKAKGLEADNVFILCPSLLPNKYALKEWEIKAEEHLEYVAYTRSKKTLNFMVEDEYKRGIGSKAYYNRMIKDINKIKEKLSFNIDNGINEDVIKNRPSTAHTLGEKVFHEISTNAKIKGGNRFKSMF